MAALYEMVFQEHKMFAFGDAERCPGCSRVLDDTTVRAEPGAAEPPFDICVTLDGCVMASHEFRLIAANLDGVSFVPIHGLVGWSTLRVDRVVQIDPIESRVRWGLPCARCGEPRYSVRDGPIRLVDGEEISSGFSRTDLGFGDTADFGPDQPVLMRPAIVVDNAARKLLKASELLGIHFITQP